ncbi:MAG: hypothetical protein KDC71_10335 [Acidobacteria bacterium]|nr:hypothetical protein [Acidobacteriota bacterium]
MVAIEVPKLLIPIFQQWADEYESEHERSNFTKAHVYHLIGTLGAIETQTIPFIREELNERQSYLQKKRLRRLFHSTQQQEGQLELVQSWLNTLEDAVAS